MNRTVPKLHLLAINQFFWPDLAPTGQLLLDVARAVEPGLNDVTTICGAPDYGSFDSTAPPPVRIIRSRLFRFSRRALARILSYATFLSSAVVNSFRINRPDVVITLTTPPLTSVLGRLIKIFRGCRHFIWEMDIYPDIAIDLGVLRRDSFVTAIIGLLADWSRRNADGIIVLGEEMKARLVARGIPASKIFIAENWADGRKIVPQPMPAGPLTVHYSGNLGLGHDIDTICGAMLAFRNRTDIRFVFAGAGARRERVERFCREGAISNVEFRPYCPHAELAVSLGEGHVGLVTQIPETCGSIVPSKTYGIMAAGRALLYVGPREATPARIIEKHECGWRVEPGDIAALTRLLDHLSINRQEIIAAGERSRCAFDANYDRMIGAGRVARILGMTPIESLEHLEVATSQSS